MLANHNPGKVIFAAQYIKAVVSVLIGNMLNGFAKKNSFILDVGGVEFVMPIVSLKNIK